MSFLHVKMYYGPCQTFNAKIHKPQLLRGLRRRLQQLGFRVDLKPVDFENYCMLEMCGYEVFRCNIKNLKFNTVVHRDVVCQRAVDAVLQAAVKFRRTRAYLWFWAQVDQQIFTRGPYGPKDYWPTPVDINFNDNDACADCCKVLKTNPKNTEKE